MCFGKKDHYDPSAVAARPTNGPPQQPTYAPSPTSKKAEAYSAPSAPPPTQSQPQAAEMPADEISSPAGPPRARTAQVAELYSAPDGPPPGLANRSVAAVPQEEYEAPSGPPPARAAANVAEQYDAPIGPPPSRAVNNVTEDYSAPSGPPPGRVFNNIVDDYAAPSGPPPPRDEKKASNNPFDPPMYTAPDGPPPPPDYTLPPTSPPPPEIQPIKKQHTWEDAVPDTSLFPPPPDIFSSHERSPTNNATEEQANAGVAWCDQHPMSPNLHLDADSLAALEAHVIRLMPPMGFYGTLEPVTLSGNEPPNGSVWRGKTKKGAQDSTIIGFPPMYSPTTHSPLASNKAKTIYYEVKIRDDSRREETSLALGYTALPYPSFRMPGWNRASLAVHGDDGHKYINDMWGGKDFTQPIQRGQTVGVGMTFTPVQGKIEVKVFFTRDGRLDGEWDLHEEADADQDLPVTGLEGFHDLSCAIGTFNMVSFDIVFDPQRWLYQPQL